MRKAILSKLILLDIWAEIKIIFQSQKKEGYKKTIIQLKNWGLKFHKLYINKPSSDIYIDDKSYGYNTRWKLNFKNIYRKIYGKLFVQILR